ncbi:potassium-transporting ATPase subunit F [Bradyrhizobium sp.]
MLFYLTYALLRPERF